VKSVNWWIICFMKVKSSLFVAFVLCMLAACGNSKNDKAKPAPPTRDSSAATEKTVPIEKVFDTVSTTPVKDSILLKFNFQKGKLYNYTMSFDVNKKKGEQSRTTTMKWNYDMQVVDTKGDLKTIKTTYKRIDMTMDMGGQKMEFSSEKQVEGMDLFQLPSKMFSIIKGKSFTMQVNEKGEIVSVTGFDKLAEDVLNEMNLPAEMKPMMEQNFKKQFNDDLVKEMFSQAFNFFPNKYVKLGDSWKRITKETALKQDMTTVYTVKNIKGSRVFISGQSKLNSNDGAPSGSQTSKLIIDARTGLMIDGALDEKITAQNMSSKGRITGKEL
jgi:hypothetical protein